MGIRKRLFTISLETKEPFSGNVSVIVHPLLHCKKQCLRDPGMDCGLMESKPALLNLKLLVGCGEVRTASMNEMVLP